MTIILAPADCRTHDTQVMTKLNYKHFASHTITLHHIGYTTSHANPAKNRLDAPTFCYITWLYGCVCKPFATYVTISTITLAVI